MQILKCPFHSLCFYNQVIFSVSNSFSSSSSENDSISNSSCSSPSSSFPSSEILLSGFESLPAEYFFFDRLQYY